ncbi:MAG: FAD-dependent oxidoreductase [Planctomycetota bacterium]
MRSARVFSSFVAVASAVCIFASCAGVRRGAAEKGAAVTNHVLLEAEAFDQTGGWLLDQQFMDLMGSPYLLAHGMGIPVEDAVTTASFPLAGSYRVWVRTRDWVAPWSAPGAPGRFQLIVDGKPLDTLFGTEGAEWHWQDGGLVEVGETARLGLHDLTGFEGRCDAVLFAKDPSWRPPEAAEDLAEFRRRTLGLPSEPEDAGSYDLVVVGGGVAGTTAAVTAARLGLSVALIQDRPVLGGNASSEVRVWPEGHFNQPPYPRVGDVVMEVVPDRGSDSKNAQRAEVFDDDRKLRVARAEPNITLLLNQRMNDASVRGGSIVSVVCQDTTTARRIRVRGRWFLDSTGDGSLGFLAGADYDQTDTGHMGASNLWNIQCLCEDEDPLSSELQAACEEAQFPRCEWAVDLSDRPFPGRDWGSTEPEAGNTNPISIGNWYWENGFDRDPIADMERIRDQNFRAMYGAWDAIKNVEKRYPAHRLNWVAYIAGKRESRRLLGDVILTAEDLRDGREWEDGAFPCTWGIDTHFPDPRFSEGHDGDEFIAGYTHGEGYVYDGPYWVPYRCLYSRNLDNLFMAGRDISVTHEALGAVRVMKTTGAMGEIVGMAASICAEHECTPRDIYEQHLDQLKALMGRGAGRREPQVEGPEGSILLAARTASLRAQQLRYEAERDCLGYWRTPDDFAEWSAKITRPGRYEVIALYACPEDEAGAGFEVRIEDREVGLVAAVRPTGSWADFAEHRLGTVELSQGSHVVSIHGGKPSGPLMKLRALRLTPVGAD